MRHGRSVDPPSYVVNSSSRKTNFQASFLTLRYISAEPLLARGPVPAIFIVLYLLVSILSGPWLSMRLLSMTVWCAQLWGVDGHPCPSGAVNKQETV